MFGGGKKTTVAIVILTCVIIICVLMLSSSISSIMLIQQNDDYEIQPEPVYEPKTTVPAPSIVTASMSTTPISIGSPNLMNDV